MEFFPLTVNDTEELLKANEYFSDGLNENQLKSSFDSSRFFGIKVTENSKLIGYITYSTTVEDADINDVFVYPPFRRQGVATELLNEFFNELKSKKLNKAFLEVRKSNLSAIKLYEKNGFKCISERKKYYPNGEDALIFCKEI